MWREGNLSTQLVRMQMGEATVENSMEGTQKLKIELLYEPGIPLLGIYLKKSEALTQKETCIFRFIAAYLQ